MSYLDRNISEDRPNAPPAPKDVRPYMNDANPVALCVSCAVKRRLQGKIINLVADRCVDKPCADCGTVKQGVLL